MATNAGICPAVANIPVPYKKSGSQNAITVSEVTKSSAIAVS